MNGEPPRLSPIASVDALLRFLFGDVAAVSVVILTFDLLAEIENYSRRRQSIPASRRRNAAIRPFPLCLQFACGLSAPGGAAGSTPQPFGNPAQSGNCG